MNTLARLLGPFRRVPLASKAVPASDASAQPQPRPMTSFFDGLSEDQKTRLRAYRGAESHGDPAYRSSNTA
jgi:hypothetical protein